MEQSVSASNTKAEAYRNRITALEQDLFRARVSRAEVENNASHVRRDFLDSSNS
jgi:cytochrome c-type biogenesis protein CcmH/NrfG